MSGYGSSTRRRDPAATRSSSALDALIIDRPPTEVDVVVVGAGAAGCVGAARLSEDPQRRVLLVEAGGWTSTEQSEVPGTAFSALGPDSLHLAQTVPQPMLDNRSVPLTTGKGLGGGSTVNLLAWFQGDPADYDAWRDDGVPGWGWDSVSPVLRHIEHFAFGADDFHGAGGPMVVDTPRDLEDTWVRLVAAAEATGLPVSSDLNGRQRTGVGLVHTNVRNGRRHSVVDGYLRPAADRTNLQVALDRRVDRVLVDDGRATGVVLADGTAVHARQSVVLTAGALRTPQLLMLSGIGPGDHLRDLGLPVVVDSPRVGANLHDHPVVPLVWSVRQGRTLLDADDERSREAYRLLRRGPQSSLPTVAAMIPLPGSRGPATVQALFYLLGLDENMTPLSEPALTATVALLTPRSRGTVRLASADPGATPLIDPAYLTDPSDLPRLLAGLDAVTRLVRADPLSDVVGPGIYPGDEATLAETEAWVRASLQTQWHPAGTVRMGAADEPVDERLAVRGVANLVVADASVMPQLPRGNTQAATIVIAERAAQWLSRRRATQPAQAH